MIHMVFAVFAVITNQVLIPSSCHENSKAKEGMIVFPRLAFIWIRKAPYYQRLHSFSLHKLAMLFFQENAGKKGS